jgi:8-oxo-dGTP pyrophosphatase MutT (NUDIX family)
LKPIAEIETAFSRHTAKRLAFEGKPARAAVGILLDPRPDDVYVFFIHRAEHEDDPWSGQMGFPGGFHEPGDLSLEHTVTREVQEEVGVDLEREARLLGPLDEIQGVAHGRELSLIISPYLYVLTSPIQVALNEEVQAVLRVSLSFLKNPKSASMVDYQIDGTTIRTPAFVYEEKVIWGLTFRMTQNLIAILHHP